MIMKTAASVLLFLATAPYYVAMAQQGCPRSSGDMTFVGASAMEQLTAAWADAWGCPSVTVTTEGGGSSAGISRACGTSQTNTVAADIAGMTRMPFTSEAGTDDGYIYKCERSVRTLIGVSC
jgi:ABC-type phosphate transport system substrate-binding protein